MISRLLAAAFIALPTSACSDDLARGREIFGRECANCHSMSRTMEMLQDVKLEQRPAHLGKVLKSHPAVLSDEDEKRVIAVLSQPG